MRKRDSLALFFFLSGAVLSILTVVSMPAVAQLQRMELAKLIAGCALMLLSVGLLRRNIASLFRRRRVQLMALMVCYMLAAVTVVALSNLLMVKHPLVIDVTEDRVFTLSKETRDFLAQLSQPIEIIGFFRPDENRFNPVKQAIAQYAMHSRDIQYRFLNPDRHPMLVRRYRVKLSSHEPRIVIHSGKRFTRVFAHSEEEFTNALIRVSRRSEISIVFSSGHDEPALDDAGEQGYRSLSQSLADQGFTVSQSELTDLVYKNNRHQIIVIASPRRSFWPTEKTMLQRYVAQGGRLLILAEPWASSSLFSLCRKWGIELGDNVVVEPDPKSSLARAGPLFPLIHLFGNHEISKDFRLSLVLPTATAIYLKSEDDRKAFTAESLAFTSSKSWAETDMQSKPPEFNPSQDKAGPLTVAVALKALSKTNEQESRIVIIGDSDFCSNRFLPVMGNENFLLNCINWLASEKKVFIRSKQRKSSRLTLSSAQLSMIQLLSIDLLPLLFLSIGLVVWTRRKWTAESPRPFRENTTH